MRDRRNLLPTDERWLEMSAGDIYWEYRQIAAIEHEKATGKTYSEADTVTDSSYEEWQKSLGILADG